MTKLLYKHYNRLVRSKGPQHDVDFYLTNKLITMGKVKVVQTWIYQGKDCRLVQAI